MTVYSLLIGLLVCIASVINAQPAGKERGPYKQSLNPVAGQLNRLGGRLLESSLPDSAISLYIKANEIATRAGDRHSSAAAYSGLGKAFYNKGKINEAIRYSDSAFHLFEQLQDTSGMSEASGNSGFYYYRLYRLTEAFDRISRSLQFAEVSGNARAVFKACYFLGIIYLELDSNLEVPKKYLLRAQEINQELKDSSLMFNIKSSLSTLYQREGNFSEAIRLLNELITYFNIHGKVYEEGISLHNLGYVYTRMEDYRQSIAFYRQALEKFRLAGDSSWMVDEYFSIGLDLAEQKNYKEAINHLLEGMAITRNLGDAENECDMAQALEEVYEKSGDFRQALVYNRRYYQLRDSLNNTAQQDKLLELKTKFETERKDKEIESLNKDKLLQEAETKRQKQLKNIMIGGVAVLLIMGGLFFNRYQIKKKASLVLEEKNRQIEQEKERAEKSEKMMQQFLATMSHEIRTPMNAIIGLSNLLAHKKLDEQGNTYVGAIRHSAGNLLKLINDILDFSKLEAGKTQILALPFDLVRMLELIRETYAPLAAEKGVKFELRIETPLGGQVLGDEGKLTQVLINLLGNALKFTEEGSITLMVNQKEVTDGRAEIEFCVKDTGMGIAKDDQALVFERFRQAKVVQNEGYGGTGLGLSIAAGLVALQGGELKMKSEEGKGSEFSFVLVYPLAGDTTKVPVHFPDVEMKSAICYTGKVQILLAEDNPYNQLVAVDTLKRYFPDAEIVLARNGKEVIEHLEEEIFDMVLMDIQMPVQDGFKTIRIIRGAGKPEWSNLPVIAFTASVIRSDLDKCVEAGMNGWVPKPFTEKELVDAVVHFSRIKFSPSVLQDKDQDEPSSEDKFRKLFITHVPVRLERIEKAVLRGDWREIRETVHLMRPQLLDMGMDEEKLGFEQFEHMDGSVPFKVWQQKSALFCRLVRERITAIHLQHG